MCARVAAGAVLALVLAGLITACGSSKPAKPAYCADVTNFKKAVTKLTDSSDPSTIASNLSNVVSTGQAAVSAVKTAFAPETAALKSSLTALETSAKQLGSSGTRAAAVQKIPGEVAAIQTAATNFVDAAHPKCS